MLDLWDRHGVKVTSHMIGEAAQRHPDLARAPSLLREGRQAASNAAFRAARANRRVGWIPAVPDLPGSRPDAMAFNTAYFSAPLVGRQAEEYPRP